MLKPYQAPYQAIHTHYPILPSNSHARYLPSSSPLYRQGDRGFKQSQAPAEEGELTHHRIEVIGTLQVCISQEIWRDIPLCSFGNVSIIKVSHQWLYSGRNMVCIHLSGCRERKGRRENARGGITLSAVFSRWDT